MEVVQNMTAEEFLLCFRRFIPQSGSPIVVISLRLLARQMYVILQSTPLVKNYAPDIEVMWVFTVEMAPWMGGFYERLL